MFHIKNWSSMWYCLWNCLCSSLSKANSL